MYLPTLINPILFNNTKFIHMNSNTTFREETGSTRLSNHQIRFDGTAGRYFGIWIVNLVLTILSLGLYYPWAKTNLRKFIWNETRLNDDKFVYHGTGQELFKGFIITYAALFALMTLVYFTNWGIILFYLALIVIVPFAMFGSWKYKMTRTSWRGIFFTFDGDFQEFLKIWFVHGLLTLVTFGIYGAWAWVKLRQYLFAHTKIGQNRLDFVGEGGELFGLNLLGGILMMITLYIYTPWFIKDRFNFAVNNTVIKHPNGEDRLISNLTGGKVFEVMIVNFLLLVVTAGLAFPLTFVRSRQMFTDHLEIPANVNLDLLEQGDIKQEGGNVGDEMVDAFDLDFDMGF